MSKKTKSKYSADMTAGSLLLYETRIVAELLLEGKGVDQIKSLVEKQNILQKRSLEASKRVFSLIRNRLSSFDDEFYRLICYSDSETSKQAVLVATLSNSSLMVEFMLTTVKEKYLTGDKSLPKVAWERFIDNLRFCDPDFPEWAPATFKKIGECVYRSLSEAGYISDSNELQAVYVSREVKVYLEAHGYNQLQQCLEVSL